MEGRAGVFLYVLCALVFVGIAIGLAIYCHRLNKKKGLKDIEDKRIRLLA